MREGLLALLSAGPRHGYQLKHDFDAALGGPKPLNVGQVYLTLDRLARDGLVEEVEGQGEVDEPAGSAGDRRRTFALTDAGRTASARWFADAVAPTTGLGRDELVAKVVLAAQTPGVDAFAVIQVERVALVEQLQVVRRQARGVDDLGARLVLDAAAARIEAEIGWLDRAEQRVQDERDRATRPREGDDGVGPAGPRKGRKR